MQRIKAEPLAERPKWCLIAVSQAARKYRNRFDLQPNETYVVGRSRTQNIHLPTPFCSNKHCILEVSDTEIIMKDQSTHGTRVNRINYKNSRCILSENDLIGFGCNTMTKHNKDINDCKYYVYRVALGTGFSANESIDLLDSSDEDENQTSNQLNTSFENGNATDDECPSADEMDVKPDIHSLMRETYAKIQIKEEILDILDLGATSTSNIRNIDELSNVPGDDEPFCLSDGEDDLFVVEPPRKKVCTDDFNYFPGMKDISSSLDGPTMAVKGTEVINGSVLMQVETQPIIQLPEYQMSEATLKEKVKNVVRSRGQQLATDMLMPNELVNNQPSTSTQTMMNGPTHGKAKFEIDDRYMPGDGKSVEELTNEFISEVTNWEYQWFTSHKDNPLRIKMDVRPLGTHFPDLVTFQSQMKNLLLMETYSIVFSEFHCKSSQHTFTRIDQSEFNANLKRYVYKGFGESKDCGGLEMQPGDFVVVSHANGKFFAYITEAKRKKAINGSTEDSGWEFELQASLVDKNKSQFKYLQIAIVTNIGAMLECFVSLYELRHSTLQEVFLNPSSQLEQKEAVNDIKKPISKKIYEKCAMSILGGSKILLLNGGVGTGKTTFIYGLLKEFDNDNFMYTKSILVCAMNNTLVDELVARVLPKIKKIARFGVLSTMKREIRKVGVEKVSSQLKDVAIVFTTVNNAVDLLHADISFDMCIVDDASLCSEAELLPLFRLRLNTLLLVGDERLQTSTTQNECCRENGYSRSLFSRVIESYRKFDEKCPKKSRPGSSPQKHFSNLNEQRRMHEAIFAWPNKYFYNNKMKMSQTPRVRVAPFEPYTVLQVNNIEDIEIEFLEKLLNFCVQKITAKQCSYGIICGHPNSKAEIETMLKANKQFNGIEVSGYDSFQGREKNIIIMVALKPVNGFALFSTKENLSIALTRAKDSLIFCGNFQHVTTHVDEMTNTWTTLLSDAKNRKRFFDTNGIFDRAQMLHLLT